MEGRNTYLDDDGNEWMIVAQYVRAVQMDFDVKISNSLVSVFRKKGMFNKLYMKKRSGRDCINYTQTVVEFLSRHPNVCPENFVGVVNEWKKKQKVKARKTIKKPDEPKDDPNDEYGASASAAIEKAKHEKIKRQVAEFQLEVIKGNYIHIDDLTPALQTIAIETRQAVKSIIPRILPIITSSTDIHENRRLLDEETDIALNHLERVPEIIDGSFQESENEKQTKEIDEET